MTAQQASGLAKFLTAVVAHEMKTSQKILAAIPEDKRDYRPHPDSRSALGIARHMPVTNLWFLEAVVNGEFTTSDEAGESAITSVAQALDLYRNEIPAALEKVKALSGEQLTTDISMRGAFTYPAVYYLSFLVRHEVHHRGQLSAYLRPMGAKVPAIYGESGDEPREMSAGQ